MITAFFQRIHFGLALTMAILLLAQNVHADQSSMAAIHKAVAEMDYEKAETLIRQAENNGGIEEREILKRIKASLEKVKFSKWLLLNPQDRDGLATAAYKEAYRLAEEWLKNGDRQYFNASVREVQKALAYSPNHLDSMTEMAWLLNEDGAFAASRQWSLRALHTANKSFLATSDGRKWEAQRLNMIALNSLRLGDFATAEKFARLAVARRSDSASLQHTLGAALMGKGDFKGARSHFDLAANIARKAGNTAMLAAAVGDRGICFLQESRRVMHPEIAGLIRQTARTNLQEALQLMPKCESAEHWKEALEMAARGNTSALFPFLRTK